MARNFKRGTLDTCGFTGLWSARFPALCRTSCIWAWASAGLGPPFSSMPGDADPLPLPPRRPALLLNKKGECGECL